jgi:hypothetical protein
MRYEESPHIELFMYSLNQEFPADKGHTTFLKRRSEVHVDAQNGRMCRLQEVETQVFSRNRIADADLPPEGVTRQPRLTGGESPTDELLASLGSERLAAKKVAVSEFDPDMVVADVPSAAAIAWTAQWASNSWTAQWAHNAGT